MTTVHANANSRVHRQAVEDRPQVLEAVAQGRALAGSRLQPDFDGEAVRLFQRPLECRHDPCEGFLFARADAGTRVHHHADQSECLGPFQLDDERLE